MICSFQPPFLGGLERRRQTSPLALFRVARHLLVICNARQHFLDGIFAYLTVETRRLKVRRRAAAEDDLAAGGRAFIDVEADVTCNDG